MKRLLVCLLVVCSAVASAQRLLQTRYSDDILSEIVVEPGRFRPVPTASSDFWRENVAEADRKFYLQLAEQYSQQAYAPIPDSIFAQFKSTGNRVNYEALSFAERRHLACVVMAEVLEHKGRYIPDIVAGLRHFISQKWWGIPAHYPVDRPDEKRQVVDLFNAESASLMAWTIYMLDDELSRADSTVCRDMRAEIDRRMLTPSLGRNGWKTVTSNWNPWICSNWLTCILMCETDRVRQIKAIGQVLKSLDIFYDAYPEDGGCDEGVMYWDRAAASLYECVQLLSLATNGKVSLAKETKFRNMAAYVWKMYIGNGYFVNFADATPRTTINDNIALPFARYVGDDTLADLTRRRWLEKDGRRPSEAAIWLASGNYPPLGRQLLMMYGGGKTEQIQAQVDVQNTSASPVYMPQLQVFAATTGNGSLYVASKGGHNGESHNHNDVGNFILYAGGKPQVVDIGVGTYTQQTFSNRRYELFNCRSAYHNVPLINGVEQHDGSKFKALDTEVLKKNSSAVFSLDIAGAYPDEACVKSWRRKIALDKSAVRVEEQYELSAYKQPTQLVFVVSGKPQIQGNGKIVLADADGAQTVLTYNRRQLTATAEPVVHNDALIERSWPNGLYRICLTLKGKSLTGKITYSFAKY